MSALILTMLVATASYSQSGDSSEEVQFESHGTILSGSLVFPDTITPIATIVLIHGAGPQERGSSLAQSLASDGFAVITYDKRGVGKSGGVYEGQDNVSEENLRLLAEDASAAFRTAMHHPRLVGVPAGFFGISQAGWIGPIAAASLPSASFVAFWSGPVYTASEALYFEAATMDDPSVAESMIQYGDAIKSNDTDPRASLRQLSLSGLWLYGAEDTIVDVELSTERLEGLIREGYSYEFEVFPGEGHNFVFGDASDSHYRRLVSWIRSVVE